MRYLVLLAFFGSGLSSLLLENLWVRMLSLVFGGTTLAIVTVLTVFMSGLALGSYLAGKVSHRIRRPFRVYGILEGCIAIYSLCIPWMIELLPSVYPWIPEDWPFLAVAFVRFLLCLAILILPTTLMGATLPLLSQYFVRERETLGTDVGLLYSLNTYGAMFGAMAGGFLILPWLGVAGSLSFAVAFLFLLSASVIWVDFRLPHGLEDEHKAANQSLAKSVKEIPGADSFFQEDEPEEVLTVWGKQAQEDFYQSLGKGQQRFQQAVVGALILTGATAMVCQVLWSRTLSMIIGSSTYAFTLILSIFLVGLASGAAYGSWLVARSLNLLQSWTRLLLGTALFVSLGTLLFDQLPWVFVNIAFRLPEQIHPLLLFSFKAGIAALPIVVPTFLMGTFFPLAIALLQHREKSVGESVGNLYMFNTVGAIVGSALAGFVVIPVLGLQQGLAACSAVYFFCASLLVWYSQNERRTYYVTFASVAILFVFLLPRWDQGLMSLGTFRLSVLRSYKYKEAMRYNPVLFYKEGMSATVTVQGNSTGRTLKINGKPEASTSGDRPTQISIAALPLALHPNPKDTALIGWGSGMTAGAALFFPIRQLVAVELEPVVIEGAKLMRPWNFAPLKDKRLQLKYNDGRNYLAATNRTFDVIISEPSNPWIRGVANLFTREYFELAHKRLKTDGVFCQWVQLYEISSKNVASILRSVHAVFPYVRLFEVTTNDSDTFLIASKKPFKFDLKRLQRVIQNPRYKKLFFYAKILSAHDLIPRFLLGEKEIPRLLKRVPAPINTDTHNLLEFTAPLDLVSTTAYQENTPFQKTVELLGRPYSSYFTLPNVKQSTKVKADFWEKVAWSYLRYGRTKAAAKLMAKVQRINPKQPNLRTMQRLTKLMRLKEKIPPLPKRAYFKELIARNKNNIRSKLRKYLVAHTLFEKDKHNLCYAKFLEVSKDKSFIRLFPKTWFYLGYCATKSDMHFQALLHFQKYVRSNPTPESSTP